jgi:hypothetical protein
LDLCGCKTNSPSQNRQQQQHFVEKIQQLHHHSLISLHLSFLLSLSLHRQQDVLVNCLIGSTTSSWFDFVEHLYILAIMQRQPTVLLCPPLDSDSDDDDKSNDAANDATPTGSSNSTSSFMSKRLHSNFETLKTTTNDSNHKRKVDEVDASDAESESAAKRHRLAQETAVLVQTELERWQNSVLELEALLAQRQRNGTLVNSNRSSSSSTSHVGRLVAPDDDGEEE